jgi:hypothetical protein
MDPRNDIATCFLYSRIPDLGLGKRRARRDDNSDGKAASDDRPGAENRSGVPAPDGIHFCPQQPTALHVHGIHYTLVFCGGAVALLVALHLKSLLWKTWESGQKGNQTNPYHPTRRPSNRSSLADVGVTIASPRSAGCGTRWAPDVRSSYSTLHPAAVVPISLHAALSCLDPVMGSQTHDANPRAIPRHVPKDPWPDL